MASVLSSIFNLLDSRSVSDIATRIGEPEHAVSRGLEASTASLIGSLAAQSKDTTVMNDVFRLISQTPPDVNIASLMNAVSGSGGASGTTASLLDSGKKFLWAAFGGDEPSVVEAIGRSAGLRMTSISSLMGLTAPLLMSALGRLVHSENMTPAQLGSWLSKESAGIQSFLPARLQRTNPNAKKLDEAARPLSITTVRDAHSRTSAWLWIIPAAVVIGLLAWFLNKDHLRRVSQSTAEQVRTGVNDLGNFVTRRLPSSVNLNVPLRGMEIRLLDFIQDPSKRPEQVTWFDFDRLLFDTDSAQLRPQSQEQLRNIAEILKAYPNVRIRVGGYTDNTGDPQRNLALSQARADGVVAQLVAMGIASDRLDARGYGDQYPIADNSTVEGRARNRRISMRVTQK